MGIGLVRKVLGGCENWDGECLGGTGTLGDFETVGDSDTMGGCDTTGGSESYCGAVKIVTGALKIVMRAVR